MSDPSQPDAWPPRWDPPPPSEATSGTPSVLTEPTWGDTARSGAGQPDLPAPATADAWTTYELPPDLPPARGHAPAADAPAPFVPTAPSAVYPTPQRRSAPWALVGAIALAATVGVAATLAFVQPWASHSDGFTSGAPATYVAPTAAPVYPTAGYPTPSSTASDNVQLAAGDPGTALRQQAMADEALIAQVPEGYWVPQLSSKREGLFADGITYTPQTIWADHVAVRTANPGAALLWSGGYTTFRYSDFWVTIMPSASSSGPDGANAWCAAHDFDADHCFAKRISTTTTYTVTTQNR